MSDIKPEKSDSNQMPQETLDRIRALAQKATPGPWICYGFTGNNGSALRTVSREDFEKICELPNLMNTPANANYIAAANPQVMLALADFIERLEAEIANLEREKIAYYKAFDKLAEKLGVFKETDPGKPETFEVFAKVFERQEKEAAWLADVMADLDCPHGCPVEDPPTLEECRDCWREAARKAVGDKQWA